MNNDRFKFRYFNSYDERIYNVLAIDFETGDIEIDNGTDNERNSILKLVPDHLLQCTGLKDKNGTPIYEGDIVKFDGSVKKVVWYSSDIEACWCTENDIGFALMGVPKYYEVIGNIYENLELLKGV